METEAVSKLGLPVFMDLSRLLELYIERYGGFGDLAATSTNLAIICALGGHLHMLWRSEHDHLNLHGIQKQVRQCTGCDAERSRKELHTVARIATALTITTRNVTLNYNILRCRCNSKIFAFGTQDQETWRCSLDLDACLHSRDFCNGGLLLDADDMDGRLFPGRYL